MTIESSSYKKKEGGIMIVKTEQIEMLTISKLFISQPMNDKTDEEIKVERAKIVDTCIKEYRKK